MTDPDELRRRARFLLIAAFLVDAAAIAALLISVLRDEDIMSMLPLAILLFVASSGLFVASLVMRRKADAAS